MSHTKGPWAIRPKRYLDTRRRVGPADNEFFDVSYSSGNSNAESEANANLIAAAPEMLEALKHVMLMFEDLEREGIKLQSTRMRVKSAIAKARGEG